MLYVYYKHMHTVYTYAFPIPHTPPSFSNVPAYIMLPYSYTWSWNSYAAHWKQLTQRVNGELSGAF